MSSIDTGIEDASESTPSAMGTDVPFAIMDELTEAVTVARARDQRTLYVNRAFERLTGRRAEEMLGRPLLSILTPGSWFGEQAPEALAELQRAGRWEGEIEERAADGTPSLARLSILTYDSPEHGALWVGVREDVTKRRRAEARHEAVVESLPAVVYVAERGADGRWSFVSPQIESLLGFTPDEWLADPALWRTRLHPGDAERVLRDVSGRTEPGAITVEYRMLDRDGKVVWVQDSAVERPGDRGGSSRWHGVLLDITEHKRAEQALARRDSILEAIGRGAARLLLDEQLDDAVQDVLGRLGRAIGASRAYVFENQRGADGRLLTSQRYEWTAPGVSAEIDNPELQDLTEEEGEGWFEALERGEAMQSLVSELPEPQRPLLERQGILTIAELPIHVGGELWGFLGLDDCETERVWAPVELDGAMVAAQALGAAVERRRAHERLSESEGRFRGAFENSSVGIAIGTMGDGGRAISANAALCEMLGYSEQELIGMSFAELTHPDDRQAQGDALARLAPGEIDSFETEKRLLHKRGHPIWVQLSLSLVRDAAGAPLYAVCLFEDITERRRSQERLAYLAYHDELTDLPNRAMFAEHLETGLARAHRHDRALAVLYLDLDRFKLINDGLGHAAGDTALREVATRLRHAVRAEDLLARHSGDEFLFLLADFERPDRRAPSWRDSDAIPPSVSATARRIHEALREPFVVEGQEFILGASIGISVFPDDAEDADALLMHADLAMFDAKRSEPGRSRIYTQKDSEGGDELALRHRLNKAVEQGEFVLHYQPFVTLEPAWEAAQAGALRLADHTSMVEALIRWEDPERGLVSPGEFIPLAEESGLIEPITDWVIEEACRQLRVWDDQGIELGISFNLSARELRLATAMRHVLDRILALGAEPERLVIELTETAAVENPTQAELQVREAHEAGLRVAIDDFGAGYSSLSRLLEIRPDLVKIDRSLTSGVPAQVRARAIVEGFIRIAQELEITPVLEGIETEEQWRYGVETGCNLGQGFYLCRPLPGDELTRQLASSRALG